jgi:hypothetical protein
VIVVRDIFREWMTDRALIPSPHILVGAVQQLAHRVGVGSIRIVRKISGQMINRTACLPGMKQADTQVARLERIVRAKLSESFNHPRGPDKIFLFQINTLEIGEQADHQQSQRDGLQLFRGDLEGSAGHMPNQVLAILWRELATAMEGVEENFPSVGKCLDHEMAG